MEVRNSKLILASYAMLGVVGLVIVFVYVRQIQDGTRANISRLDESMMDAPHPSPRPEVRLAQRNRQPDSSDQLQRIETLRQALESRSALLQQRSVELQEKTAEHDALREEAERYFSLLSELLLRGSAVSRVSYKVPVSEGRRLGEAGPEGDTDQDVELAAWELIEAQQQIDDLELAALREQEWSTAIATAIAESGELAVPALISVLMHERADLRRWAATLLGRIGPEAEDAVEVLHTIALYDDDQQARRAAQWALEQIEKQP